MIVCSTESLASLEPSEGMNMDRVGIAKTRRGDLETVVVYGATKTIVTRRRRREARPVQIEGVRWVVARVLSGFEFAVADDLAAVGFRSFAPHAVTVALRGRVGGGEQRRKALRETPVFAGYLFVGCPEGLLLAKLSHDRLLDVLTSVEARQSARVAEAVAMISKLHCAGVFDERTRRVAGYGVGEVVRIKDGPFAGYNGAIAALPHDMRIKVEISLFGRSVPVEMGPRQIERV